jgi:hypothetical protein
LSLAVATSCAIASPSHANVSFANAPKQTEAQAKYFTWENQAGGLHCATKGKMKELVEDPYKCYIKLDECKASFDALTGKLDPEMAQLFADLAQIDPAAPKASFVNTCPGDGPEFVESLAIRGLGYLRNPANAKTLQTIVEGERAKAIGPGLRTEVTEALHFMGSKDAAEASYKNLLSVTSMDPEYKDLILWDLARWNSDAGVEFCQAALTDDGQKKTHDACIFYLGMRKTTAAIPLLQRGFEKKEIVTLHAYGQMGDKALLKDIQAYLEAKDGQPGRTRIPALVAAANYGDKKALAELLTWAAGKKPMSKKDQEKAAKAKKKPAKTDEKVDPEFIMYAAMESLLLTDADAIKQMNKALQTAAASKDEKAWKGFVYATVALAQRGDAKAIAAVGELINHTKEDIRNAAISAVGGREADVGEYWYFAGKGYIADASIVAALEKYYGVEGKKENKSRAIRALATTQMMLVAPAK